MAEGAFNQSLVLVVDDDGEREVIGFAPGPAGVESRIEARRGGRSAGREVRRTP